MNADEAKAMLRFAAEVGLFQIDDQSLAMEVILRRPFWSNAANKFVYDDVVAIPVIEMAIAGNREADALLREFAAELLPKGLEPNLAAYIRGQFLVDRKQPGKGAGRPRKLEYRDAWICALVQTAQRLGPFDATRSSATAELTPERACGCSIVADVLKEMGMSMSEKNVEKIWSHRPH